MPGWLVVGFSCFRISLRFFIFIHDIGKVSFGMLHVEPIPANDQPETDRDSYFRKVGLKIEIYF
jgi:hypothetical protein